MKSDFGFSSLVEGLWKPGIAVVAALKPTNELGLNHAAWSTSDELSIAEALLNGAYMRSVWVV